MTNYIENIDLNRLALLSTSTLHIYRRNNIVCIAHNHPVIDVVATYPTLNDKLAKIPVQYCKQCRKMFISETVFEHYRKMYRFLPIHMRYTTNNGTYTQHSTFVERAKESPLMLCGYNTNQSVGLSLESRHNILRFIIEHKILSKQDVINYLELFINTNGMKNNMDIAVSKWEEDLRYVSLYRFDVQAKSSIIAIVPYR